MGFDIPGRARLTGKPRSSKSVIKDKRAFSGYVGKGLQSYNVRVPTGVIDDRGKFIYITPEELAAVANFIRQRGRVSITELAQASNSLISWGQDLPAQASV